MAYNHLYKCEECDVVKAWKTDYGKTRAEFCKVCNSVTFHYLIYIAQWPFGYNVDSSGIKVICPSEVVQKKEKNDDTRSNEEKT